MLAYFAHGSNLWTPRLEHRVGPVLALGVGVLDGFALRWHKRSSDGSGKCDVVAIAGAQVWGVLYDVAAHQMQTLDTVEGVGHGYERDETLSVTHNGAVVPVSTYRAQPAHIDGALLPFDWYHALVLAGARRHTLPRAYIAAIARQPVRADPDVARAARESAWLDAIADT